MGPGAQALLRVWGFSRHYFGFVMGSGEVSTPGEGSRTAWLCLEPYGPDRAQRCDVCAEAALTGGGFGSSCRFGLDPTIWG